MEAVSIAGDGVNNEDTWGSTENSAWVLDGATEPDDGERPTRPAQLVARVSEALARLIENYADPRAALSAAIAEASALTWVGPIPPSSTIALVRLTGNRLSVLRLGDASVVTAESTLAKTIDRDQTRVQPDAEHMKTLMETRRTSMNHEGGYWIVADDPAAAWHAVVAEWTVRPGDRILIATDGVTRLVDLFQVHNHASLLECASTAGVAALVADVRRAEAAAPRHDVFQRAKHSDDATAVLLEVELIDATGTVLPLTKYPVDCGATSRRRHRSAPVNDGPETSIIDCV